MMYQLMYKEFYECESISDVHSDIWHYHYATILINGNKFDWQDGVMIAMFASRHAYMFNRFIYDAFFVYI